MKNICELLTPPDLGDSPTACDFWERKAYALEQQVHELRQEIAALKADAPVKELSA